MTSPHVPVWNDGVFHCVAQVAENHPNQPPTRTSIRILPTTTFDVFWMILQAESPQVFTKIYGVVAGLDAGGTEGRTSRILADCRGKCQSQVEDRDSRVGNRPRLATCFATREGSVGVRRLGRGSSDSGSCHTRGGSDLARRFSWQRNGWLRVRAPQLGRRRRPRISFAYPWSTHLLQFSWGWISAEACAEKTGASSRDQEDDLDI